MSKITIRDILSDNDLVEYVGENDGEKVYETRPNVTILAGDTINVDKYTKVDILAAKANIVNVHTRCVSTVYSYDDTLIVLR